MRKTSVSAQLSRTARRFSTVIAPQLTKVEPIAVLQKHLKLIIQIADITMVQEAIKQFVLHNNRHFNPIEFEIRLPDISSSHSVGKSDSAIILTAQFYADEIVLFEGTRRLVSISLSDACGSATADIQSPTSVNPFTFTSQPVSTNNSIDSPINMGGFGTTLAKIRHPISGFKIFEIVESTQVGETHQSWIISGMMDELNKCRVETHKNLWRQILAACGFSFANGQWWSIEHAGIRVAQIQPLTACWAENGIQIEWAADANNEIRLLALCFGVIQTVREAYPSLMHICMGKKKTII